MLSIRAGQLAVLTPVGTKLVVGVALIKIGSRG